MFKIALFLLLSSALFCEDISHAIQKYGTSIEITNSSSGMPLIDCIYLINLDRRPDRLKRMDELCQRYGLHYNRVHAVDGTKLPPEAPKELCGPFVGSLKNGELGCMLSHLSVLKDAYDRGYDTIWVMEDDLIFLKEPLTFIETLQSLIQLDPKWDVFLQIKNV